VHLFVDQHCLVLAEGCECTCTSLISQLMNNCILSSSLIHGITTSMFLISACRFVRRWDWEMVFKRYCEFLSIHERVSEFKCVSAWHISTIFS